MHVQEWGDYATECTRNHFEWGSLLLDTVCFLMVYPMGVKCRQPLSSHFQPEMVYNIKKSFKFIHTIVKTVQNII